MRRFLRVIDGVSTATGRFAMWALLVVTAIVVYEVITRRVFGSPHVWTYEIITFFYGFHFMILAGYTLLTHGHVSIDIVYNRLAPKTKAMVDVITYLVFFFPFVLVLLKVGVTFASSSWATHEVTLTARLPFFMPAMKTITPVTAFLLFLQGLAIFIRRLHFLMKGEEL